MWVSGRASSAVERGFPHLEVVRDAIAALYRRLSVDSVEQFAVSVPPVDVALDPDEELYGGVQRVARALVRHFRLPDARVIVAFREMELAAEVELSAGPEYFVELNRRFKEHRRDIGAALAHEITHVYLHRLELVFPGVAENEILTDTVSTYLGAGWLLLDAFREDSLSSQKLGYLTPEEFGYVLAKRAEVFGEDPSVWFSSPQGYEAYVRGRTRAAEDARRPPLAGGGWVARRRYGHDRRLARTRMRPGQSAFGGEGYRFEWASGVRVSFRCPRCQQRLRVPLRGEVRVRCAGCAQVWSVDT
ncbi:hypothetical protein H3146_08205 [Streptomyces sp. OF3]|uniref:Uncharacterized protein n=1 Tax=Streptomyces alkaliterrae TaxID=2213162 RepID=A0A7W3WJ71_9ACTN|nr:hypothetical protein [Streptomyces alkaliterrae]MBB1253353.1 hypothetical protein [Streptomyces alkaliterrae]